MSVGAASRPILESARLLLRELTVGDHDFMADLLGHPEVSRYYERSFTRDDALAWIERQLTRYARDGCGLWLAADRRTGIPVGQVGLLLQEVDSVRTPEIGWLLHRQFWGRGYATEAATAVRDAAFDRWGHTRVISLIRPENEPSSRVAERIGMRPGRTVEFHGFPHLEYAAVRAGTPASGVA